MPTGTVDREIYSKRILPGMQVVQDSESEIESSACDSDPAASIGLLSQILDSKPYGPSAELQKLLAAPYPRFDSDSADSDFDLEHQKELDKFAKDDSNTDAEETLLACGLKATRHV